MVALVGAACGGGGGGDGGGAGTPTPLTLGEKKIIPIPGNSELVIGPNRFTLALIDAENEPVLAEPGTSVRFNFTGPDGGTAEQDSRFVWAIPDENGFFAADVQFDAPGQWSVEAALTRDGERTTVPYSFTVLDRGQAPKVGDAAPGTDNLTLAREPNIRRVSTDETPDPALYQLTVTQALQAGKPFVVVFATPAFCQTRFCGPILDNVKAARRGFEETVSFIHIEPYELDAEGQLVTDAQGNLVVAQPMLDWRLLTEPWVYIVGADGKIRARFEGAAGAEELRQAVEQTLG